MPDRFRSWWYLKAENLPTNEIVKFNIKNRGWPFYYVPLYSFDNVNWNRFREDQVTLNADNEIVITADFSKSDVWLARFYPYSFSDLERFIDKVKSHPYVEVEISGHSQNGRPIYLLKLTQFEVPVSGKKRVFIHARTHSAETPGSYLVEGVVSWLLQGSPLAERMMFTHEFYIFPMHNVDGVIAGNYRTTPKSENLEVLWKYDVNNPIDLIDDVPVEVKVIHEYAKKLMTDDGPNVSFALNLHASNSEPETRPFFFPHFGTLEQGYSETESNLWCKQGAFINRVKSYYRPFQFEPSPDEGGSEFADKTYPESWWWVNFKDAVIAMTMEITYDEAGYYPFRIDPDAMRRIGGCLVDAIKDFYSVPSDNILKSYIPEPSEGVVGDLKYPELYPPRAPDELKE